MKTKIAAFVAGIGGLCALCCVVPVAGFLGLGALEAFFCDSPWAVGMGIGLMILGLSYLVYKYWRGACGSACTTLSCAVGCGNK